MSKDIKLEIFDVEAANLSNFTLAMVMQLTSDKLSVRELISNRVKSEVERYNNREIFNGLVTPDEIETRLNNNSIKNSAEKYIEIALDAFEKNLYFLIVDDEQVVDLDQEITITKETHVAFYRLTPVVGG